MANQLGIVHPEMLARLQANFYPSVCAIQSATETPDSFGQLQQSWSNLAGHGAIPCRVAPESNPRGEIRDQAQTFAVHRWRIVLNGYYPSIIEKMRAVVNATAYDIERVEHDGNEEMTRLVCRIVT